MTKYELWENWSKINKPDKLICTSISKQNIEMIKVALEKIKGLHNFYIKEIQKNGFVVNP